MSSTTAVRDPKVREAQPAEKPNLRTALKSWTSALSSESRKEVIEQYAEKPGRVVELGLLLRIPGQLIEECDDLPYSEQMSRIVNSNLDQANKVRNFWHELGFHDHPFGAVRILGNLGICFVRAPAQHVVRFLGHGGLKDQVNTPVTALLPSRYCVAASMFSSISKKFASAAPTPSILDYDPDKNFCDAVSLIENIGTSSDSYIKYLGIDGLAEIAAESKGRGTLLCCIDSGCDESHPALQQSLREHLMYNSYGCYKEAPYSTDRGCHGSKVVGASLARPVHLSHLGIDIDGVIGLGIAPEANVVAFSALEGAPFSEGGTISQLAMAFEDLIHRRRMCRYVDPNSLGDYDVCNISIAPQVVLENAITDAIDRVFDKLHYDGIAVILPCGNEPKHSSRLGTKGVYVGACDRHGNPWDPNLPGADVLVPGVDLILTQPSKDLLGQYLIGLHTGTSFAAGVFSGIVLVLIEHTQRPALDVTDALIQTRDEVGRLQIPLAVDLLRSKPAAG